MYKIGELARLTQVPVRTLRHYDVVGVLRPAFVDPASRYRRYGAHQIAELNRILALKDLGFTLDEIRAHLHDRTPPGQLLAAVEAKHVELESRFERERHRLARARARLALLQRDLVAVPEIAIRTVGAQLVASLRATIGSHDEQRRLDDELDHAVGGRGRHRGAIFHACSRGAIDCEVFVAVPARVQRGRVRTRELPAHRVAARVYRGDTEFMSAYRELRTWLSLSGLTIAGPKRELELDADDGSWTEVQFPLSA